MIETPLLVQYDTRYTFFLPSLPLPFPNIYHELSIDKKSPTPFLLGQLTMSLSAIAVVSNSPFCKFFGLLLREATLFVKLCLLFSHRISSEPTFFVEFFGNLPSHVPRHSMLLKRGVRGDSTFVFT